MGAREAAARLTEAARIVPMLPEYVWLHVLGETAASMAAWPAGKLASKQLNAIANMEGANTADDDTATRWLAYLHGLVECVNRIYNHILGSGC